MARNIVTGIELTKDWVKIAQVENPPFGKLLRIGAMKVTGLSDTEISQVISGFIKGSNYESTRVVSSIPRELVSVRLLRLPSAKKEELDRMIDFQAAKLTPYSKEDIITGYEILEIEPTGFAKIRLAIVHKDVINKHVDIMQKVGLKSDAIRLSSHAACNLYTVKKPSQDDVVVLVDVDAAGSSLEIMMGKETYFSRSIPVGTRQFREAEGEIREAWQSRLLSEIMRSFLAYESEGHLARPKKMILTAGESEAMVGLQEFLASELKMPVEVHNSLQKFPATSKAKRERDSIPKGVSLTIALGLACDAQESGLNLLPKEIISKRQLHVFRKELVVAATLLTLIMLAGFSIFTQKIYANRQYIAYLSREVAKTEDEALKIEEMKKKVEVIRDQLQMERSALDILYELSRIIPENIFLTTLIFEEEKQVLIRGTANALSDVFKLVSVLEESLYFKNVKSEQASMRTIYRQEVVDFEIICQLEI